MIIIRLIYLAVCLLVLLKVVSTMGGNNGEYKYYNSEVNSSVCLSFRTNRLTDCCKQDDMQQIYVHKVSPFTGIFHVKDYKKVLCYDRRKMKFKIYRRRNLGLRSCRHQKKRERQNRLKGRQYTGCSLTKADENRLIKKGCELYDHLGYGIAYISAEKSALFLGLRKGRVQKHKRLRRNRIREPKERGFFLLGDKRITPNRNMCRA